MCAATALPLRRAKVSVQRTVAERPLSFTVAVNTPAAFAGAFGAGTSLFGVSVARYEYVFVFAAVLFPLVVAVLSTVVVDPEPYP